MKNKGIILKEIIRRECRIHKNVSTTTWDADWYNIRKTQGIVVMSQIWNELLAYIEDKVNIR